MESSTCYSLTDWGPELWALGCVWHCSSLIIKPPPPIPPLGSNSMNVCTCVFVWLCVLFKTRKRSRIKRRVGQRKGDSTIFSLVVAWGCLCGSEGYFQQMRMLVSNIYLSWVPGHLSNRLCDDYCVIIIILLLRWRFDFTLIAWTCQVSIFATSVQTYYHKHKQFLC